jgi:endonuclease/exonuclease/phosphatase family metal-dependent hydrolase
MSWLNKLLIIINIFIAAALIACWFNTWVNNSLLFALPFFGLLFIPLLLINCIAMLYWALQLKWPILISLVAVGANYFNITNTIALKGDNIKLVDANANTIKIMTYNVRDFDLYNWGKSDHCREGIEKLILTQNPDILCIQEFYSTDNEIVQPHYNLLKTLQKQYPFFYFNNTTTLRNTDRWGIVVFSKYKIENKTEIEFENKRTENSALFCDISLPTKTVRVFNMHLQSIHLANKDYKYLDKINIDTDEEVEKGVNIIRKLKRAFIKRANQADNVAKAIAASPYPTIVCGDFNDLPSSYSYHTIKSNLKDAFIEAGFGLGTTYAKNIPGVRIDYVLVDKSIHVSSFKILPFKFSDHYAISTNISF